MVNAGDIDNMLLNNLSILGQFCVWGDGLRFIAPYNVG